MTIIITPYVWHAKEPSLLSGHECRTYVIICSPSSVMVTSPYELKTPEWDDKPQTNKQKQNENRVFYK